MIADTKEIWGHNFFVIGTTGDFVKNLCGEPYWRDDIVDIDVNMVHSATTLNLEFRSSLDQNPDDESWGIR